jgi:hypothetical protein
MSIWRRRPRQPWYGPETLKMQLKEPGDRYSTIRVRPLVRNAPGVQLDIQSGAMASVSQLSEYEVRTLAEALLDALEASMALVDGGEGQEPGPGG